jgi:hypothetical protein
MGLWRGKVQSIFMGFYILPRADGKEESTYQEKDTYKKKRREKKQKTMGNNYQEAQHTSSWTRGLTSSKKRRIIMCKSYQKNIAKCRIWNRYVYIF